MYVIYVDDEQPALDNFRLTVSAFREINGLELFQTGREALAWVREHPVDVAFLDMEMPEIHGLSLAARIRELSPDTRIVFVTVYSKYAMAAWDADAIGYVLKPYSAADIHKELKKCVYSPLPSQRVMIETIPSLSVTVDGVAVHLTRSKSRELFALLVDRGERGITTSEGIACLWPDRPDDTNTHALFRMTYKRLSDSLEELGIGYIIGSEESRRFLRVDQVSCDLYRILAGDMQAAQKYNGEYMREYSWAEERNGQLNRILLDKD